MDIRLTVVAPSADLLISWEPAIVIQGADIVVAYVVPGIVLHIVAIERPAGLSRVSDTVIVNPEVLVDVAVTSSAESRQ
jgi:hypothetical protein